MIPTDIHYHDWFGIVFFIFIYSMVLLLFPFYRKMKSKPKGTYLAFVIAFAIEMHGIPFSFYVISYLFNKQMPLGFF